MESLLAEGERLLAKATYSYAPYLRPYSRPLGRAASGGGQTVGPGGGRT